MKKLMLFVMAFVVVGCAEKEPKIVYVDRFNEVKIPQKCIVPDTECTIEKTATYTEIIKDMRLCIEELRRNSEVCK
ncbi:MAG: hypothetical protein PHX44_01315 [Sulfurimonas sp.]|uniref:hypothetical protein n=1 Tax=Sulfurimonas sp. TaxID=2022749 RepID=UPI0026142A39|nr:hypothetical protein [Sulfurimonas sp.]MDD2651672.1 hypothetical protein [Sulfurimonas sp.]MDD3451483.1 hypothetical protein [Sulfurimonas sp.]